MSIFQLKGFYSSDHVGWRSELPDTFVERNHPRTIPPKFGLNWPSGFTGEYFFSNCWRTDADKWSSNITDNMITFNGISVLNFKFKRYSLNQSIICRKVLFSNDLLITSTLNPFSELLPNLYYSPIKKLAIVYDFVEKFSRLPVFF
jgi:hypothetical protein